MSCSGKDYAYLRRMVLTESANVIDASRDARFEARLIPLAQRVGADSVQELVGLLRLDRAKHLHRAVAEAMTIGETSFFRDVWPFEALRETILPRLIRANAAKRRLRIWSAASSTGQEAYSVAMMLCESFPELLQWDVKIVGTDISHQAIAYAERARYRRLEVNRGLPARMLVKHFVREGEEWEVSGRVRALCEFRCLNLCSPLASLPAFDLVLLRNVLLYFPQQDREDVFRAVSGKMSGGGYLLLGAAEQAEDSTDLFRAEFSNDCYFYRLAGELQG